MLVEVAGKVGEVEQHGWREVVGNQGEGESGLHSQAKIRLGHCPVKITKMALLWESWKFITCFSKQINKKNIPR